MVHINFPHVNPDINAHDIFLAPCQISPPLLHTQSSIYIPRKRMHHHPRILSFPAAVVSFCKSLRLPFARSRCFLYASKTPLVASPAQIDTAAMEMNGSILVHKEPSQDAVEDKESFHTDTTITSFFSELQSRSKSPPSMISSPIVDRWDASALEVCLVLTYDYVLFSLTSSSHPVPQLPNIPPKMRN